MIHAHELEGLAPDDARAIQFTAVGQSLCEPVEIADRGDQPAAAGEVAVGPSEVGGLRIVLQAEGIAGLVLVAGGEAIQPVAGHSEEGIRHVQRVEDVVGKILVQRLAGQHLDQVAAHVGGQRVVPCGARRKLQRKAGQLVDQVFQRQARVAVQSELAVGRVNIGAAGEAVAEAGLMGQQIPNGHRALGGDGDEIRVDTGLVHLQVTPAGNVFVYRVVQQESPLLIELHQRH